MDFAKDTDHTNMSKRALDIRSMSIEDLKTNLYEIDARLARLTLQSERLDPSQDAEVVTLRAETDRLHNNHVGIVSAMNKIWDQEDEAEAQQDDTVTQQDGVVTEKDEATTSQRIRGSHVAKIWRPRENVIIAQGIIDGLTYAAIAKTLPGRTEETVTQHSSVIRVPELRFTSREAQQARLQELRDAYTPELNGHNFHSGRWSKKEEQDLLLAYKEGLSWNQIADRFPGRTKSACQNRAKLLRDRYLKFNHRDTKYSGVSKIRDISRNLRREKK